MEKSVVGVEESQRKNDSVASASKPAVGSIVQIDSISIDINCAMEEIEPEEHDHFSIREFVAGMWEISRKTCMPFGTTEGDDHVMDDNVPPLSIRKFRWWKCSTCVSDIAAEKTTAPEKQPAGKNDAGTSFHSTGDKEKDGTISPDTKQTGDENRSRDLGCNNDSDPSNKTIDQSQQSTEENKATSSREMVVRDDEGGNAPTCAIEAEPMEITGRDSNASIEPSVVPEEVPENASSGSDNGINAVQRRRRKLRSLVDIMDEEKNSTSEKSRMGSASTEVEADLEPGLHLDGPVDVAKVTKSPQRKRKDVLGEDGRELEVAKLTSVSKRLKGSILRAEETSTTVDSETEGGASALLDLRDTAKPLQIKSKKSKSHNIIRKMRQTHTDNKTMPRREVPKVNDMQSPNIPKHISTTETRLGNAGHVASMLGGDIGPHFPSFLLGQQMDKISNLSKGKALVLESRYSPLMHTCKSSLNDHNIHREVALDLSLNSYSVEGKNSNNQISLGQHTEIPDLNESFMEKMPVMQVGQLPSLSEMRRSTLLRELEMIPSCSKDPAVEVIRKSGVAQPQAIQNNDNNAEPGGASDDIPMDIVELLAKNQRERALGNSKQQHIPDGINNPVRGSSPFYADGRPSTVNFPFPYTGSSASVVQGKMPFSQGIASFPQSKNCQFGLVNAESRFRFFNSFQPSQPYSAPNFRARPNEESDLLWPPRQKNMRLRPSIAPVNPVHPNPLNFHSFSDHRNKGKTVSSAKGNQKRSLWNSSAGNDGRMGSSSKPVGSVDTYSNDTIPAMQLLSLMDRGIASNSSYKVGPNSFLDKNLPPYNHQSQLKVNGNQNDPFLNSSLFSQNSQNPGIPRLINGVYVPGESSKKPPLQGQTPPEQGSSKPNNLEGPSIARPSNEDLELGICVVNKNPADFSTPDEGNQYMISHRDLKCQKRSASKERSHKDGQKKQRVRKNSRK